MRILKLSITSFLLLLLSGCHRETMDHDYLMRHPDVLQNAYSACERTDNLPNCDQVRAAARDFMVLVDLRSRDPEKFGSQIMELQSQLAKLKAEHATDGKIQDIHRQLSLLYAVVAATSAE